MTAMRFVGEIFSLWFKGIRAAPREFRRHANMGLECGQCGVFQRSLGLNSEKFNTEDTKGHREPQRNWPFFFRRPLFSVSSKPSVLSVVFLRVLCVKFRKAQHRGRKVSQRATEKSAFLFPSSTTSRFKRGFLSAR